MTRTPELWYLDIRGDVAIVGYNPEGADMANPNGAIFREVFHLLATNERGDRRTWGTFATEADALEAIATAPAVLLWADTWPEYGSEAWAEYGEADMVAWERQQEQQVW